MTILTPFTDNQYISALINLLPQGLLWDSFKNKETYMYKTLAALSFPFSDLDNGLCEVIDEVFPATSTNLLPIWQETLGLTAGNDSLAEQRNKVIAKLTMEASLARQYYINYAKQLGFTITIQEYGAVIPGIFRIGDSIGTTDDYSYEFQITIFTKGLEATNPLSDTLEYDGTALQIDASNIYFPSLPTSTPSGNQLYQVNGMVKQQSGTQPPAAQTSITSVVLFNPNTSTADFTKYGVVFFPDLPTSDPGYKGQVWSNAGQVCISNSTVEYEQQEVEDLTYTVVGNTWVVFQADKLFMPNLPTSMPDHKGQLWNDGGLLCQSTSQNTSSNQLEEYLNPILPAYITAYYVNT